METRKTVEVTVVALFRLVRASDGGNSANVQRYKTELCRCRVFDIPKLAGDGICCTCNEGAMDTGKWGLRLPELRESDRAIPG